MSDSIRRHDVDPADARNPDRRDFLKTATVATGALWAGGACAGYGDQEAVQEPPAPMSILVLGGTGFIGPHMVEYAVGRGHEVTLFNRGRTNTHLFPDLEKLVGDRDGDLAALEGRNWDAVLDNTGYVPRMVRDSAELLADSGRYVFVSSISAYKDLGPHGITEDYEVGRLDDPTVEEWRGPAYGPLKALCEDVAQEVFGDRATVVRPGYIVGPGDGTDRWTYWPVRVAAGGAMAAPGAPSDPSDAEFRWIDSAFVEEQGVRFPIWGPPDHPTWGGAHLVDNTRAIEAGYASRPAVETVRDTLEWWNGLSEDDRPDGMRSGLRKPPELGGGPATLEAMREVEAQLLAAWEDAGG